MLNAVWRVSIWATTTAFTKTNNAIAWIAATMYLTHYLIMGLILIPIATTALDHRRRFHRMILFLVVVENRVAGAGLAETGDEQRTRTECL